MVSNWSEATQKTYLAEGLAVGSRLLGVTAVLNDKLALESAFRSVWIRWHPSRYFPQVRSTLARTDIWHVLLDSEGRRHASVGYWTHDTPWLVPVLRQSWSVDEHAEHLADLSGISVDAWVDLTRAQLDHMPAENNHREGSSPTP